MQQPEGALRAGPGPAPTVMPRPLPGRVFGNPYKSGQPILFNRETPWYIIDAVMPVERPVVDWAVTKHFVPAASNPSLREGTGAAGSPGRGGAPSVSSTARTPRASHAGGKQSGPCAAARRRDTGSGASPERCEACCEPEPGPGHYDLPSSFREGPAFSMGAKTGRSTWLPCGRGQQEAPGPGQYHTNTGPPDGPAFSIAGRTQPPASKDLVPGPGTYNAEQGLGTIGPAFSLGAQLPDRTDKTPGPGDYSVQRAFEEPGGNGPAFSMMGRPRPERPRGEGEPGPGDFVHHEPAIQGPAFTFGERLQEGAEKPTPGPGHVTLPSCISEGKAWTMTGRPKPLREKLHVPGPGAYSVTRRFDDGATDGPAYSIQGRVEERSVGGTSPGPADYDALGTEAAGPSWSLTGRSKSAFDERRSESPAPGHYTCADVIGRDAAAFSMGCKWKEPMREDKRDYWTPADPADSPAFTMGGRPEAPEVEQMPGPGEYDATLRGESGPAFSMGSRPEPAKDQGLPAPGEYQLADTWKEGPAFSIAGRVPEPRLQDVPGVGEYTLNGGSPDGPHFTMAGRPGAAKEDDVPGPGDYDHGVADHGPAHTFGNRLIDPQLAEAAEKPGPGSYMVQAEPGGPSFSIGERAAPQEEYTDLGPGRYDIRDDKAQGPAFTMGGKAKDVDPGAADEPGPGDYHAVDSKPQGPSFSLYSRAKEHEPDINLGPGQYTPLLPKDGPAITMGTKLLEPDFSSDLGPGQYDAPHLSVGPAITIGASSRPGLVDADAEDTPGPGAYSLDVGRDGGPAFTMAAKAPMDVETLGPGPGAHDVPEMHPGPSFSIAERLPNAPEERDRVEQPGPGAYETLSRFCEGPAFSLASRLDAIPDDTTPGPGFYSLTKSERGAAFTIASKTADPTSALALKEAAETPAPGDYGAPGQESRPGCSFTIRGRLKEKPRDGPGPGDYAPGDRPSGPAYTMGMKIKDKKGRWCKNKSTKRGGNENQLETPGPQDYVPYTRNDGPAFSLGGKTQGLRHKASPSPGSYDIRSPHEGAAYSMGPSLVHGSPWADALRRAREPGPGAYNDAKPFPRPLGNAATSLHPRRATMFVEE